MEENHSLSLDIATKTATSGMNILEHNADEIEFDSNALLKEDNTKTPTEIENTEDKPVKNANISNALEGHGNSKSNIEINCDYEQDEPIRVESENDLLEENGNDICSDSLEEVSAELSNCRIELKDNCIEKSQFNSQDQLNTLELEIYKSGANGNTEELITSGIADCKEPSLDSFLNPVNTSTLVIRKFNSNKLIDKIKESDGKNELSNPNFENTCKALVRYHPYFTPLANLANYQESSLTSLLDVKEKPKEFKVLISLPRDLPIEQPNIMNSQFGNLSAPVNFPIRLVVNKGLSHTETLIPPSMDKLDLIDNCNDQLGEEMKFDAQSSDVQQNNTSLDYKSRTVDTCTVNNCSGIAPYCPYANYLSINSDKNWNTEMNVIPSSYDLPQARGNPQELEVSTILQESSTNKQEINGQPSDLELNNTSLEDEKCMILNKSSCQTSEKESFIDSADSMTNINIPSKVNFTYSQSLEVEKNDDNISKKRCNADNKLGCDFSSWSSPEDEILNKRVKLAIETLDHDIDCENKEPSQSLYIERDVIDDLDEIIERSIEKFESFTAEKGILATPTTSEQSSQTCDKLPDQFRICKRSLFKNEDPNLPKKLKYNNHMSNENPPPTELPQFEESVSQFYITPPSKVQFLAEEGESEDDGDSEKSMFNDQDTEFSHAHWNWSSESDSSKKSTKDQHVPYSPMNMSFLSSSGSSLDVDEADDSSITETTDDISSVSEYSEGESPTTESSEVESSADDDSELAKTLIDD